MGRAVARRLVAGFAQLRPGVRARFRPCRIFGAQSCVVVLRFSVSILISQPQTHHHPLSGAGRRGQILAHVPRGPSGIPQWSKKSLATEGKTVPRRSFRQMYTHPWNVCVSLCFEKGGGRNEGLCRHLYLLNTKHFT
jgi:hypothetical protein